MPWDSVDKWRDEDDSERRGGRPGGWTTRRLVERVGSQGRRFHERLRARLQDRARSTRACGTLARPPRGDGTVTGRPTDGRR